MEKTPKLIVFRFYRQLSSMGPGAVTSLSLGFLISKMKSHFSKSYDRLLCEVHSVGTGA